MELALAIGGCTVAELDERMTEGEFYLWQLFARENFLPARRSQLQAAQTAYLIARTMGGAKPSTKFADFLIVPNTKDSDMDADAGGAMISAATSARVYRLGQGRKVKA